MSRRRHRHRIDRLGDQARQVARPEPAATSEALDRARVRLTARLKLAADEELDELERHALADHAQSAADARTVRLDLEARGDSSEAMRRRVRERLVLP